MGKPQLSTNDTHREQTDTPPRHGTWVWVLIVKNDASKLLSSTLTVRGVLLERMFYTVDLSRLGAEWMALLWLKDMQSSYMWEAESC